MTLSKSLKMVLLTRDLQSPTGVAEFTLYGVYRARNYETISPDFKVTSPDFRVISSYKVISKIRNHFRSRFWKAAISTTVL